MRNNKYLKDYYPQICGDLFKGGVDICYKDFSKFWQILSSGIPISGISEFLIKSLSDSNLYIALFYPQLLGMEYGMMLKFWNQIGVFLQQQIYGNINLPFYMSLKIEKFP